MRLPDKCLEVNWNEMFSIQMSGCKMFSIQMSGCKMFSIQMSGNEVFSIQISGSPNVYGTCVLAHLKEITLCFHALVGSFDTYSCITSLSLSVFCTLVGSLLKMGKMERK